MSGWVDERAVRRLAERYALAVDRRDAEALAELFAADAVLVTAGGEMRGHDDIRAIPQRLGERYRVTHHLVSGHDVRFEPSAAAATGTVECLAKHVYEQEGIERVYVMHLRYHDRYRRDGDRWVFAERRLELLWDEDHPLRR